MDGIVTLQFALPQLPEELRKLIWQWCFCCFRGILLQTLPTFHYCPFSKIQIIRDHTLVLKTSKQLYYYLLDKDSVVTSSKSILFQRKHSSTSTTTSTPTSSTTSTAIPETPRFKLQHPKHSHQWHISSHQDIHILNGKIQVFNGKRKIEINLDFIDFVTIPDGRLVISLKNGSVQIWG